MNGYKKTYTFPNGYGASVISNGMSYGGSKGLFEVAVLDKNGDICYNTPVTDDVLGYLDFSDVVDVLNQIKAL